MEYSKFLSLALILNFHNLSRNEYDRISAFMSIYEEVEFEDLDYDPRTQIYTYPCPCGDKFSISLEALWDGEDIATCPSCTLRIGIIYDEEDLPPLRNDDDDDVDDDDGYDEGSVEEGDDSKEEGKGEEEDEEEKKSGKENDEIDEGLAVVARKSLSVR